MVSGYTGVLGGKVGLFEIQVSILVRDGSRTEQVPVAVDLLVDVSVNSAKSRRQIASPSNGQY